MGQARDLLDRLTKEAVDSRDIDAMAEVYSDDAVVVTPDAGEVRGRDQIADYWQQFLDSFPDSSYEVLRKHEAGDAAIDEGWLVGTNTGPLHLATGETLPATGRSMKVRSCDVATVEHGKIIEHRLYFDQVEFLRQLGLAPESPQPPS